MTLGELTAGRSAPLLCEPADFLDETLDQIIAAHDNAVIVVERTGEIVGLLTKDNVVKAVQAASALGDSIAREHVFSWMTVSPTQISHSVPIDEAFAILDRKKVKAAIIMKEDRPLCVLTISDVLAALHEQDVSLIHEMRGMLFRPLTHNASLGSQERR